MVQGIKPDFPSPVSRKCISDRAQCHHVSQHQVGSLPGPSCVHTEEQEEVSHSVVATLEGVQGLSEIHIRDSSLILTGLPGGAVGRR